MRENSEPVVYTSHWELGDVVKKPLEDLVVHSRNLPEDYFVSTNEDGRSGRHLSTNAPSPFSYTKELNDVFLLWSSMKDLKSVVHSSSLKHKSF